MVATYRKKHALNRNLIFLQDGRDITKETFSRTAEQKSNLKCNSAPMWLVGAEESQTSC